MNQIIDAYAEALIGCKTPAHKEIFAALLCDIMTDDIDFFVTYGGNSYDRLKQAIEDKRRAESPSFIELVIG